MRILLDQAVYDQRNKGNVSLLQSAISRLSQLWPHASIQVLTEAPHLLKLYCPTVHPVSVHPGQDFSQKQEHFDRLHRFIPLICWQLLFELRDEMQYRLPGFSLGQLRQQAKLLLRLNRTPQISDVSKDSDPREAEDNPAQVTKPDLLRAIQTADLVVATGGGYLCDADKQYTLQVFETLETAVRLGKPTAMVGQGVGPLHDPDLRARLKNLLPKLDLILIREPKVARPLLESLGVAPERVLMTGDDAIEMAYETRSSKWGNYIGVNLRAARYTEVDHTYIEKIRPALHRAARKYDAPLMALPISVHRQEDDLRIIRELLRGYSKVSIDWRRFNPPMDTIKKIGRCRLVVTGAFHPAVFALAQGIPVVGLVKSIAYQDKFGALHDEFGSACQILHLDDEQLTEKLAAAIETAWVSAEEVRPALLQAAVRQIEWGRAGYRHLYDLVEGKKRMYEHRSSSNSLLDRSVESVRVKRD